MDERKFIRRPIPGTKHIRDQTYLSTGVLHLDSLLGGGIQLGSILLIEEDEFGVFSKYLLKYFLAEGLECKHCTFVGSLDSDVHQLMTELPSAVDYSETSRLPESSTSGGSEDLKIAWRYQDSPRVQSAPTNTATSTFGHNFDLTVPLAKEAVDNAEIAYWPQSWPTGVDSDDPYTSCLEELRERIHRQGHSLAAVPGRRTVLRVALHRLGSPMWPNEPSRLTRFLYCLRKLVHAANAAAVITLPFNLLQESVVSGCEHLCDNVIRLQSLANNSNPLYSEYNGLLAIHKLSTRNCINSHVPDTNDWAFKLRKRRFVVEKLHLPPELQDSAQREQDDVGLSCASFHQKDLDF